MRSLIKIYSKISLSILQYAHRIFIIGTLQAHKVFQGNIDNFVFTK